MCSYRMYIACTDVLGLKVNLESYNQGYIIKSKHQGKILV